MAERPPYWSLWLTRLAQTSRCPSSSPPLHQRGLINGIRTALHDRTTFFYVGITTPADCSSWDLHLCLPLDFGGGAAAEVPGGRLDLLRETFFSALIQYSRLAFFFTLLWEHWNP